LSVLIIGKLYILQRKSVVSINQNKIYAIDYDDFPQNTITVLWQIENNDTNIGYGNISSFTPIIYQPFITVTQTTSSDSRTSPTTQPKQTTNTKKSATLLSKSPTANRPNDVPTISDKIPQSTSKNIIIRGVLCLHSPSI